jgi:hypothetical protein
MNAQRFDELYNSVPDAYGGVTLSLRQPIPTRDASSIRTRDPGLPIFGPNASIRLASARERGTRDEGGELLKAVNSGVLIDLGRQYSATNTGGSPELAAKVSQIRALITPFTPPNVLRALDPGTMIDLGRVWVAQASEGQERDSVMKMLDEAQELWKAEAPTYSLGTQKTPASQRSEAQQLRKPSDGPLSSSMYPRSAATDAPHDLGPAVDRPVTTDRAFANRNGSSVYAAARRTQDVAWARFNAGRAELTSRGQPSGNQPSVNRTPAAQYSDNLKAGRAAKRRA